MEFTARILKACKFDIITLWQYIAATWIMTELIFFSIEKLVYGYAFHHIGDLILTALLFSYFGYCTWILGSYEELNKKDKRWNYK